MSAFDLRHFDIEAAASRSATRLELWEEVLRLARPKRVAEVGVWKGDFAQRVLERCRSIERYYMIDPWESLQDWNKPFNVDQKAFDDIYAEALAKTAFASEKIVVLRGRTKDVVDEIADDSIDFVYLDGDHTLRGITLDLISMFPKVKEDGLIGGDDFTLNPWHHGAAYEPTLVFPFVAYFAEAKDIPLAALSRDQFLMQKKSSASFCFLGGEDERRDVSLGKLLLRPVKDRLRAGMKSTLRRIAAPVRAWRRRSGE